MTKSAPPRPPVAPYRLYGGGLPATPKREPAFAAAAAPAAAAASSAPGPVPTAAAAPSPARLRRPTGEAGDGWGRVAAYDAYADGLHTYAIWSLHDHDAAVDALYTAFVIADRNVAQLREPEFTQPWLYAILRHECLARATGGNPAPMPVSLRLRPPSGPAADPGGSLASLERSLRRAEFHSLEWPESEGLAPAHREILELTIRHGLDSQGLGLVLGSAGSKGPVGPRGFGALTDAWRELERSLAAVAVAKGPREHCAQLAELTFGWSGRLNATLRAPLTDHVDGCTRCQHYLHTVVGTPAAPTILPFVAAPRALREIVLDELADPAVAQRAGVDHAALADRIARFSADGFPVPGEPDPVRRRAARRAEHRAPSPAPAPASASAEAPTPAPAPRRPAPGPSANGKSADLYRSPGSWADRVLPPTSPDSVRAPAPGNSRADARTARAPERPSGTAPSGRRRAEPGPGAEPAAQQRRQPAKAAGEPPAFVATHSGRSAARTAAVSPEPEGRHRNAPERPKPGGRSGLGNLSDLAAFGLFADEGSETGLAAFPGTSAEAGAGGASAHHRHRTTARPHSPAAKQQARHRSRHVRKAVVSVVALGAVGAVAAATAALLGVSADENTNQTLGSAAGPAASSTVTPHGLHTSSLPLITATVSSPGPVGAAEPVPPVPFRSGAQPGIGSGFVVPGTGGAGSSGPGAADFYVSVNQRDGDPNSITILLRNTGTAPVAWSAQDADSWITLSQSSGTLAAGQETDVVAAATTAAPPGRWTSSVVFSPGGAVVTLNGESAGSPSATAPSNGSSGPSTPPPSQPPSPSRSAGGSGSPSGGSGAPGSGGPSSTPSSAGPTASSAPAPASSAASSSSRTKPSGTSRASRPSGH